MFNALHVSRISGSVVSLYRKPTISYLDFCFQLVSGSNVFGLQTACCQLMIKYLYIKNIKVESLDIFIQVRTVRIHLTFKK